MSEQINGLKSDKESHEVPHDWRVVISGIVDEFKAGNYGLENSIDGVQALSKKKADAISNNIKEYGVTISSLPEEAWGAAVCQWYGGHWEVMVSLYSSENEETDLILHLRVFETNTGYNFNVKLVYVP